MVIKLETTKAHLALMEIINGNKMLTFDDVMQHMENARWHANAMLEGGESEENIIIPLTEEHLRKHVQKLSEQIPELNGLIHKRYEAYVNGTDSATSHIKLHAAYERFIEQANNSEEHIHEHVSDILNDFRMFNFFMLGFIIITSLLTAIVLYSNEKQRIGHLQLLLDAQEKLEQLSNTDKLTGVANRRAFDNALENEYKRAMRDGTPLTLIMVDVDFFKPFNDHYGHIEGDYCLKVIAETIQKQCNRQSDLVSRYGGEEFSIILPNMEEAHILAERLRKTVEDLRFVHEYSTVSNYVTISAGFCTMNPEQETTPDVLLRNADRALYQAKSQGRNQVVDCSTSVASDS